MDRASADQVTELRRVSGLPIQTCADILNNLPASERNAFIAKVKDNGLLPPRPMPRDDEHSPNPNAARIIT
jgi:hypothetical protein